VNEGAKQPAVASSLTLEVLGIDRQRRAWPKRPQPRRGEGGRIGNGHGPADLFLAKR
jgi:hypothetical protein